MGETTRQGGCNYGRIRIQLRGEPLRAGLCHCLTCRKERGSSFMAFAVWNKDRVSVLGETGSWKATTDHRHFCPVCGSALFGTNDENGEFEVRLGTLDEAPSGLTPEDELWTPWREHWQRAVASAVQHSANRR
jgi:hypothetical protein